MHTRRRMLAGAGAAAALPAASRAQGVAGLAAIASTLKDAADVVGKLADNVLKATQDGLKLWDIATARGHRQRYLDLTQGLTRLYTSQNVRVMRSMTEYIRYYGAAAKPLSAAAKADLARNWDTFRTSIGETLGYVQSLTVNLTADRDLFVATPAYRDLMENLGAKSQVLLALQTMPAPMTDPEITQLKQVDLEFRHLHEALSHLIEAVDAYVAAS